MIKQTIALLDNTLLSIFLGLTVTLLASCGGGGGGSSDVDPLLDSDGDGLSDVAESNLGTNPFDGDTDDDWLGDGMEVQLQTDPLDPDTDADQLIDGFEVDLGSNPRVADPVTILSGRVLGEDLMDAEGIVVELKNPRLERQYEGFHQETDFLGDYRFDWPWPTAMHAGTTVEARTAGGALRTASLELPPLTAGDVVLPDLVLARHPWTRGKDFFITLPYVVRSHISSIATMAIMNSGSKPAEVTWSIPGTTFEGSLSVPPHGARSAGLPAEELQVEPSFRYQAPIELVSRGVRVHSSEPVVISVQTYGDATFRDSMGVFVAQPISSYGKEYFLQTLTSCEFCSGSIDGGGYAMVTAGVSDCALELDLSIPMTMLTNGQEISIVPGVPIESSVDFEDALQFVAAGESLNGSILRSSVPFGVFAGSTNLSGDELHGNLRGSVALESLAPTDQWGTDFVTFGSIGNVDSRVHVLAGPDGARVTIGALQPVELLEGEERSVSLDQNDAITIQSDRPILVWQLFGFYHSFSGGAASVSLSPADRWSTDEVVWAFSAKEMKNSIAVLAPTPSLEQVLLDGKVFRDLPLAVEVSVNSNYRILISPVADGAHRITSPEPVFPLVFGSFDLELPGETRYAYAYTSVW